MNASKSNVTANVVLPAAPVAERTLIGAVLIDRMALDAALAAGLEPADFSEPAHRDAWAAILTAFRNGQGLTPPVLMEYGASRELLLSALDDAAGAAAFPENYAGIIKDKSQRRSFIDAALKAVAQAGGSTPMDEVLGSLLNFGLAKAGQRGTVTFAQMVRGWLESQLKGESSGMPTGIPGLDRISGAGGLYKDLNVLAARPSMGKTQAALQIIESVAEAGGAVLFVSMDTPQEQITARQLARRLRTTGNELRERLREAPNGILPRIKAVQQELELLPIFYRFGPSSIFDVRLEARRLAARGDLALVVVDYLQQLDTGEKGADEFNRATQASRAMKELAGELGVPVLALSQLSRSLEGRPNKRPMMSDLRQSGQIEQDAALIIGLYREHYYDKEADPEAAEWIVLKQKDGPVGTLHMRFRPGTGFEDTGEWEEF